MQRSGGRDLTQEWCERADGAREGPYRSISNGRLSTEGAYVDGRQDGAWTSYWPDGRVHEQTQYARGLQDGAWVVYAAGGGIEVRGAYRHGKQHGTWTWWHPNGRKKGVTVYVDGKEQGRATEWDEGGAVVSDGAYVRGRQVGLWIESHARGSYCAGKRCGRWKFVDGDTTVIGAYRDGLRDGVWSAWFDRSIQTRASYVRGRKDGWTRRWDLDTGRELTETECRAGRPEGVRRAFSSAGQVVLDSHYAAGRLEGKQVQIDAGHLAVSQYRHGELVSGPPVEPDTGAGIDPDGYIAIDDCTNDDVLGERDEPSS